MLSNMSNDNNNNNYRNNNSIQIRPSTLEQKIDNGEDVLF
jgi:hypothetical protein